MPDWMIEREYKTYAQRTRARAASAIRDILAQHPDATGAARLGLLRAGYPFDRSESRPYQIWREEVRRALRVPVSRRRMAARAEPALGQITLFQEEIR